MSADIDQSVHYVWVVIVVWTITLTAAYVIAEVVA
jgi:cobalamin biosynthesis protein CobD/CbiB